MDKIQTMIYGCGGAGINIAYAVQSLDHCKAAGNFECRFIDTSESNVRNLSVRDDDVFFIEGLDGGGKHRSIPYEAIKRAAPTILNRFKPGRFNIVVSSASGGSGAVIAQVLVDQMLAAKQNVVMIIIGTTSSGIEIENTVKTLRSLELLADRSGRPVVMHYMLNTSATRANVDANAIDACLQLAGLFNNQHAELDSADLSAWLTHASLGRRLVSLHFAYDQAGYSRIQSALSVATLAKRGSDTDLSPIPAYQAVGYVADDWLVSGATSPAAVMHAVIGDDQTLKNVEDLLASFQQVSGDVAARQRREAIVGKDIASTANDDGVIL